MPKILLISLSNTNFKGDRSIYLYGQLIFNKDAKVFKGERKVLWINGAETTGYPHAKEYEIPPLYTKIKAKLTKDLNVRMKTLRLLEGKRYKSSGPSKRQWFLTYDTKKHKQQKKTTDKLNFIKMKNCFVFQRSGRKYLQITYLIRVQHQNIWRNYSSIIKRQIVQFKNWQKI